MDRKTLLAITLCFGIFLGWQKLYLEPQMKSQAPVAAQTAPAPVDAMMAKPVNSAMTANPQTKLVPSARTERADAKSMPVTTGAGVAHIGNGARIFSGWTLKNYRVGTKAETDAIDLKTVTHQEEGELSFDLQDYAYLNNVQGELSEIPGGAAWSYEDANVRLRREVRTVAGQPYADVQLTAQFKTKRPGFAFVSLGTQVVKDDPEAADRQLIYWTKQSIERVAVDDKIKLTSVATDTKWIGATSRYFLMTLVANGPEPRGLVQPVYPSTPDAQHGGRASLVYPITGDTITIPLKAYFGPKELELLRAVDPTLDHAVDLGWFTVFAYPMLKIMKWLYAFFGNYGVAIVLLTLLVKLVTYPLTYKSMKSMKQMQKLQPQLTRLREKYKDDKEALNREMLTVMKTHGYNPAAGCLPILIQMPVFFALYRVLYSSIELYHAPFMLWINDLSAKDPYYVTPVLLTATMFFQQKLTPTTGMDPAQAKMMQFMPVIFGFMMVSLPAGLTVYMLVNAIASIAQQMILNKKFDTGHVTAAVARG